MQVRPAPVSKRLAGVGAGKGRRRQRGISGAVAVLNLVFSHRVSHLHHFHDPSCPFKPMESLIVPGLRPGMRSLAGIGVEGVELWHFVDFDQRHARRRLRDRTYHVTNTLRMFDNLPTGSFRTFFTVSV